MDLFSYEPDSYPASPGYRRTDTSCLAAEAMRPCAKTLRDKVVTILQFVGPLTADQCAERLGIDKGAIRPRLTELKLDGKVVDTGERRPNASGKRAIVWRLAA